MEINNIVIVGSGKVATNLAVALKSIEKNILCIYSRNVENAKKLAERIDSSFTNNYCDIPDKADLYIISVKDSAIAQVVSEMKVQSGIVVHTSGSVNISVFNDKFSDFGVFYPLMHFSADKQVGFSEIPLCVEANNTSNLETIRRLALQLSHNVHTISSEQRMILHLSAVIASNFTNLNYVIAEDILKKNKLSFDLLRPIIIETANKACNDSPAKMQTGPAIREDTEVMKEHVRLLGDLPQYQKLYKLLSDIIIRKKRDHEL